MDVQESSVSPLLILYNIQEYPNANKLFWHQTPFLLTIGKHKTGRQTTFNEILHGVIQKNPYNITVEMLMLPSND